ALNNLVAAENFKFLRDSSIIIAAANTTLVTKNAPFEIWHGSFNISLFKKYSKIAGLTPSENERTSGITAYFRGYSNRQSIEIEDDTWYQMDVKGKELTSADITSHKIGAIEAFVK